MKHRKKHKKLGRKTHHRLATLRNLSASLIKEERVKTTEAKAKACQSFVEKLITKAGEYSLHRYRQVLSKLQDEDATKKLFEKVGPMFEDRPGGYTRILKLGGMRWFEGGEYAAKQLGDDADRVLFELVEKTDEVETEEEEEEEE